VQTKANISVLKYSIHTTGYLSASASIYFIRFRQTLAETCNLTMVRVPVRKIIIFCALDFFADGLVVSSLVFCSEDPSSNPAGYLLTFCNKP